MHVHFLDPYHERVSLVHRLDARVKLPLALGIILAAALLPVGAWPAYLLVYALLLSAELVSQLGITFFLKRSLLAVPFLLAALPLVFSLPGPYLADIQFGQIHLQLSAAGVERLLSVGLKSWLSVQTAVLLASTTRFVDLLAALRFLRIPRLLVAVIGLMWRYLFVLVDEGYRLNRARAARSAGARPGGGLGWRAGVTGGMAGSLLLRSLERADRIYLAMLARGYNGETRTLPPPPLTTADWIAMTAGLLVLASIVLTA